MNTNGKLSVKQLAVAGVMAALVFVMTYLPKVPVPITGGYIHLGDGMIFLGAMLLGPVGIASAAVGSALSDLVGGYMVYILPTFLIKGVMALVAWKLYKPGNVLQTALAFILAEVVMVAGYFGYAALLLGKGIGAAASVPGNLVQGAVGLVAGFLLLQVARRTHLEEKVSV